MRTHLALLALLATIVGIWSFAALAEVPNAVRPPAWEYHVLSPLELAGVEQPLSLRELRDPAAKERRTAAALKHLDQLGAEGWELIDIENDHFYFKRPKVVQ